MKSVIQKRLFFYSFFGLLFIVTGCSGVKTVGFKTPVDTTSKYIQIQEKKIFKLSDVGVYASNQFDGARLNGLKKINDTTAYIFINPENTPINNSAYYAFKVWSDSPKPFYFTFKYPKGYNHRYIPKLKIGNRWSIIDSTKVFKQDSIVTIKLNLDKSPMIVAAQEVNSTTNVKNWFSNLVKGKEGYVTIESAGKSKLGRNLPVLDICIGDKKGKDMIVLLTRQHPPEITGYFAFQEFMQTVLNGSELSQNFLENYHVIALPVMNPDGVDLGHWRHNAGGVDLNRDWSVYNQPEIKQVVKFISKSLKKYKSKLILGIDFHSTWYDVFYTNLMREGTALPHFTDDWFSAIEDHMEGYKVNEKPGNNMKPVSKGWFLHGHKAVGITFEIGDATSKENIRKIGKVTAEQMMHILLDKSLMK
jgi:hypothetical protein